MRIAGGGGGEAVVSDRPRYPLTRGRSFATGVARLLSMRVAGADQPSVLARKKNGEEDEQEDEQKVTRCHLFLHSSPNMLL